MVPRISENVTLMVCVKKYYRENGTAVFCFEILCICGYIRTLNHDMSSTNNYLNIPIVRCTSAKNINAKIGMIYPNIDLFNIPLHSQRNHMYYLIIVNKIII